MRTVLLIALAGALHAGFALAQRRPATEADAMSYITSAFISQADPGVLSPGVALGPELEKALGLQSGTDRVKVYQAVVPLADDPRLEVRRAAPADVADYGARRGLDPAARHPLFTVAAGNVKLLVQYDLQALNILYVGQLGLPDPDPRPLLAKAEPGGAAGKKPVLVNVPLTAEFSYGSDQLTPEALARLDGEIVPKIHRVEGHPLPARSWAQRSHGLGRAQPPAVRGAPRTCARISSRKASGPTGYAVGPAVTH